jgi:DNA-binding GntR family transcriptional regulator
MSRIVRYQVDDETGTGPGIGQPASLAAIVNQLEEDIVFGRLHPCQRVIEDDLITRFAAKRHVVRQALADLERMGLIERIPNRGALVRAYGPDEVKQLYVVRDLLETQAACRSFYLI